MKRRRGLAVLLGLALGVGLLIAGCGRAPLQQASGAHLGTLSYGQISFSSLSFQALSNTAYTNLAPSISAVATGLGNATMTTWSSDLTANWDLVYACVNNGSNKPHGTFNYSLYDAELTYHQINSGEITSNGTATINLQTPSNYLDTTFSRLVSNGDVSTSVCPNTQNYTLQALGYRWNDITINLLETGDNGTTVADSISYVCSDPGDPSSQTCTVK